MVTEVKILMLNVIFLVVIRRINACMNNFLSCSFGYNWEEFVENLHQLQQLFHQKEFQPIVVLMSKNIP